MMPEKEWNTIFQYHQAITVALKVAIEDLEGDDEDVYFHELWFYNEDGDEEENLFNKVAVDKGDDVAQAQDQTEWRLEYLSDSHDERRRASCH